MIETYGPERQQELASQTNRELPQSGRYERVGDDDNDIEAKVTEDEVEIYDIYGMRLQTLSVGKFVMRVQMGIYRRVDGGRHV